MRCEARVASGEWGRWVRGFVRAVAGFQRASFPVLVLLGVLHAGAQESSITVQSNLVLVPTLVQDAKGGVLYGLKAGQFLLKDNGVPQTVRVEDSEGATPLSLVVVVQCSRDAWRQQDNLRGLANMVEGLTGEAVQETAVVSFGTEPKLIGHFTSDPAKTHEVLSGYQPCDDGGNSIFDAVAYGEKLLESRDPHRRRAILLISETRDHGSDKKAQDVIARLGKSNIVVDAVAFSPFKTAAVEDLKHGDGGTGGLFGLLLAAVQAVRTNAPKEFAKLSGGEYINFTTERGFDRGLGALANHVHNGYLLSFVPHGREGEAVEPGLHEMTVEVPEYKSKVRHRESYWYGNAVTP